MKFIICCAGTAGHINPAIAIADALKMQYPDAVFLFIGSGREMENRLIPMSGYAIENIHCSGLERGVGIKKIASHAKTITSVLKSYFTAKSIIRNFSPDAVVGTGGYVCYPVLLSAHRFRIPTFIHESNAIPGLTTKLLCGIVDRVFVAFPDMEKYYKKPERVVYTGTPVRSGFNCLSQEEAKKSLGLSGKKVVVSFWGSLGADVPNRATVELIAENERTGDFHHIHATGGGNFGFSAFASMLSEKGVCVENLAYTDLRSYIDNMPIVMKAADLVLCRSGASTLGELTAIGKPSVLIPSPNVTDNHQEKNAHRIAESGGAVMLLEKECSGGTLPVLVRKLLTDPKKLSEMAKAVGSIGVTDSEKRIVREISSLLKK